LLKDLDNSYIQLRFDNYKPEDPFKGGMDSESASDAEDSMFASGQKKTSVLNYDEYYSKEKALASIQVTVVDEYQSNVALGAIPDGFEHEIDFNKYFPRSVYYTFAVSGKSGKRISDLQNDTFYESLKNFFETEYTNNKHFELD
jgi:hypothetical protein